MPGGLRAPHLSFLPRWCTSAQTWSRPRSTPLFQRREAVLAAGAPARGYSRKTAGQGPGTAATQRSGPTRASGCWLQLHRVRASTDTRALFTSQRAIISFICSRVFLNLCWAAASPPAPSLSLIKEVWIRALPHVNVCLIMTWLIISRALQNLQLNLFHIIGSRNFYLSTWLN